ncbi:methyltransf_25 domain-containing protein, partial [Haematococcus lacustris]
MFRVLKPGGLCVLTDSTQLGDRPEWDNLVANFGKFDEPWYVSFINHKLGETFQAAGFQPHIKYVSSATKTLSFLKPPGIQELLNKLARLAASGEPQAASYWAYHVSRFSFFVTQAAAGLVAHHAAETLGSSFQPNSPPILFTPEKPGSAGTPLQRLGANASA